mmetsp:Transcript_43904/g.139857  ORF Transcript_43904/g.139857 Transcript_43904/m.139857 type:complete len:86 (+) Transcript_43904:591-848(+)
MATRSRSIAGLQDARAAMAGEGGKQEPGGGSPEFGAGNTGGGVQSLPPGAMRKPLAPVLKARSEMLRIGFRGRSMPQKESPQTEK